MKTPTELGTSSNGQDKLIASPSWLVCLVVVKVFILSGVLCPVPPFVSAIQYPDTARRNQSRSQSAVAAAVSLTRIKSGVDRYQRPTNLKTVHLIKYSENERANGLFEAATLQKAKTLATRLSYSEYDRTVSPTPTNTLNTKKVLPIGSQVTFQLQVGFAKRSNPATRLLSANQPAPPSHANTSSISLTTVDVAH
jgi:hypothetical protein